MMASVKKCRKLSDHDVWQCIHVK